MKTLRANQKLEQIIEHIKSGEMTKKDIQFYVGYSGWGIGQLEEEHKANKTYIQTPDRPSQRLLC